MQIYFIMLIMATSWTVLSMNKIKNINFTDFNENDWVKVRESRFPSAGCFQRVKEGITNFIPEKTNEEDLYHAKGGVGFALRLLKDLKMYNGRLELELKLYRNAAPSIYFRTQTEGDVHKETYNLVIFNHTAIKPGYQGINLYKWKKEWRDSKKEGWKRMATWIFPVPQNKKINLAVEFIKAEINIWCNDEKIGSFWDVEPLPAGNIGVCAIEGRSHFYNFSITEK